MDRIIKIVEEAFALGGDPVPKFGAGDVIEAHMKIKEKGKERIQKLEGVVIEVRRKQCGSGSFLIRKVADDVSIERIIRFPSPNLVKIVVKRRAIVRRAKLSYLQKLNSNTKMKLKYRIKS